MADQDTAAPAAAPVVFDPPLIYMHRDARVPPLPVYTQAQADALPPEWMAPDVWGAGGGGGGGGSQTPWTGDVDAASYSLNNASNLRAQYLYLPANGGIAFSGIWMYYDVGSNSLLINGNVDAAGHNLNNVANISGTTPHNPELQFGYGILNVNASYMQFGVAGAPYVISIESGQGKLHIQVPQYADLAAAQAALGAGSGVVWRDPNNALFVA